MPTPFPGMDPYLEQADLWVNVHTSLIIAIRDDLAPRLRPRYYLAVEERAVCLGPEDLAFAVRPDVAVARATALTPMSLAGQLGQEVGIVTVELPMPEEIHEVYLELREARTDQIVTVLEILSPTNKLPGEGRRQYEQKRLNILGTQTHLVEIDLLRGGPPMPMRGYQGQSDYRLLISRAEKRPKADLIPFSVRQPIPSVRVPLLAGEAEPEVDLNRLVHDLYDRAGYDMRLDYNGDPEPPLKGDDAVWADKLLREAGLR